MAIKKLKVTNFKSFKELEVELGNFNVMIGANASGKSNFVHIFEFLRDIIRSGLTNAISMQGGVHYLRNINIGPCENLSVCIVSDQKFGLIGRRTKNGLIGIKIKEIIYEFSLKFKKKGLGFNITKDRLIQKCDFVLLERQKKNLGEKEKIGEGEIILYRSNGKTQIDLKKPEEVQINKEDIFPRLRFLREEKYSSKTLLIEKPVIFLPPVEIVFSEISIYDFDPRLPKKATPITGKAELEEDGSNLSIILKGILDDREKRRKFFNLLKDMLPFIDKVDTENFADKSLLFKVQEVYSKKQFLPASLISDGTINITALIIALYFEKKRLTIIEEPERNIHPYLISKLIEMMKEASQKKQIIVTTHNPEIVKYAGLENLMLILRNNEGFSVINKPSNKEEVKAFLKNEIGIEELFVQNLLGT